MKTKSNMGARNRPDPKSEKVKPSRALSGGVKEINLNIEDSVHIVFNDDKGMLSSYSVKSNDVRNAMKEWFVRLKKTGFSV